MTKLITRPVNRVFSFGCSFTEYYWAGTWPEIIAKDLDVPLYNYGKSGAGNQYIANMVSQADQFYKFNENDLVIISWTNVSREDRWVNGQWITPGNIFTQGEYDEKFVKKWADPLGYLFRDLATIKYVDSLLKTTGCQYHFISMCDIAAHINQNELLDTYDSKFINQYNQLCELYKPYLEKIEKSFFTGLWKNNMYQYKLLPDKEVFGPYFSDGHPTPSEHFEYLKLTFDHVFKQETVEAVNVSNENLVNFIKDISDQKKKQFSLWHLPWEELHKLKSATRIKESEDPKRIY